MSTEKLLVYFTTRLTDSHPQESKTTCSETLGRPPAQDLHSLSTGSGTARLCDGDRCRYPQELKIMCSVMLGRPPAAACTGLVPHNSAEPRTVKLPDVDAQSCANTRLTPSPRNRTMLMAANGGQQHSKFSASALANLGQPWPF
jgi:hypothetical protein